MKKRQKNDNVKEETLCSPEHLLAPKFQHTQSMPQHRQETVLLLSLNGSVSNAKKLYLSIYSTIHNSICKSSAVIRNLVYYNGAGVKS